MKRAAVVELASPAAIARALRVRRARLGWVTRRIREAERLAGALEQWRAMRLAHPEIGDFVRSPEGPERAA
jgi:hypothetical protein